MFSFQIFDGENGRNRLRGAKVKIFNQFPYGYDTRWE